MPEFVMEGRDHAARAESDFVLGFIEAMFFTECSPAFDSSEWFTDERRAATEEGTADGELPGDVGYTDLHPDSLAAIRADCESWQAENAALLALAYATGYDETQAGHDYWFTRNGHGIGFWDRDKLAVDVWSEESGFVDDWPGPLAYSLTYGAPHSTLAGTLGDMLTDACRYREVHVFFGDHVTHGDAPFVHVDL